MDISNWGEHQKEENYLVLSSDTITIQVQPVQCNFWFSVDNSQLILTFERSMSQISAFGVGRGRWDY